MNHTSDLIASGRPKFLADAMLGRLAKWLRLMGYDTKYVSDIADTDLLDVAEAENRIILTRDISLIERKRCRRYIFVQSDHWREQLRQVYRAARLDCECMLTLCALCNSRLQPVEKESIQARVPPYVYATQKDFYECTRCARVFWRATHVSKILEEIKPLKGES